MRFLQTLKAVLMRLIAILLIVVVSIFIGRFVTSNFFKSIKDITSISQIAEIANKKSNKASRRSLAGVKNVGDSVDVYQKNLPNCPYFDYLMFVPQNTNIYFESSEKRLFEITKTDIEEFITDCKNAFGDKYSVGIIQSREKETLSSVTYYPVVITLSWKIKEKLVVAQFLPVSEIRKCVDIDKAQKSKIDMQIKLQTKIDDTKDKYFTAMPFELSLYDKPDCVSGKDYKPLTEAERKLYLAGIDL